MQTWYSKLSQRIKLHVYVSCIHQTGTHASLVYATNCECAMKGNLYCGLLLTDYQHISTQTRPTHPTSVGLANTLPNHLHYIHVNGMGNLGAIHNRTLLVYSEITEMVGWGGVSITHSTVSLEQKTKAATHETERRFVPIELTESLLADLLVHLLHHPSDLILSQVLGSNKNAISNHSPFQDRCHWATTGISVLKIPNMGIF